MNLDAHIKMLEYGESPFIQKLNIESDLTRLKIASILLSETIDSAVYLKSVEAEAIEMVAGA